MNTIAQIPNSGFENWTTFGNYMQPNGWVTTNEYASGPFYAVTRDTSHFPSSVGSYSIRLENNTALGFPQAGGAAKTGDTLLSSDGKFPISGHPTSLTGYYKFIPQNGDTMLIRVRLFQGSEVATASFRTTTGASEWTTFNLPIPLYTTADSAEILLAAFNINPGTTPFPQGNSILFVDNLNFDIPITSGISEVNEIHAISVYPNPFNSSATIQFNSEMRNAELNIYNLFGQKIKTINNISQQEIKLYRDNLPSGMYFIYLTEDDKTIMTDKLVIAD